MNVIIKALEFIPVIIVSLFWLVFSGVMTMLLVIFYPLLYPFGGRSFCQKIASYFAEVVWVPLVRFVEHWGRWEIRFSGDQIPDRETVIAISNHRWLLDWLMIFTLSIRKGRLGVTKLFAKTSVALIPGLGWGCYFLDFIFLSRDWAKDKDSIAATFNKLKVRKLPFWVISHLEGTRFSEKKVKESQDFAKKKDLPILKNCLLPRLKGIIATVEGLRDGAGVTALYDITIVYNDGKKPPVYSDVFFRRGGVVNIHVRRYPIESLPKDPNQLGEWVMERWKEKDALIDILLKKGMFPDQQKEPYRHLGLNLF